MKQTIFFFLFLFFSFVLMAQRPAADKIETGKGSLLVQPVFHGSLVLSWNNKTIYVDPYGGAKAFEGLAAPDLVLITDIHGDHLHMETLNAINTDKAIFIVPQAVADQLPANIKTKAVVLGNNSTTVQFGISVLALPMYNLPETPDAKHTKGRGNGYVLELGGKRVYLSGDTEDIPEMRSLTNIDVAFVCMNLPYTMDINQAASAVLAFKPKMVYPYHYRTPEGFSDMEAFKKLVNTENTLIEVRVRNWYPEYK